MARISDQIAGEESDAPGGRGQEQRDRGEAEDLHHHVGERGAGAAEKVARDAVGGAVEARIPDRPAQQADPADGGHGHQPGARQSHRQAMELFLHSAR